MGMGQEQSKCPVYKKYPISPTKKWKFQEKPAFACEIYRKNQTSLTPQYWQRHCRQSVEKRDTQVITLVVL